MPSWYGNWQQVQPLTDKSMDLLTRSLGNLSNAWQGLGNSGINYLQREIDRRDLIDAKNRASNTQLILSKLNQADTLEDKERLLNAGYADFGAIRSMLNNGDFDERVVNDNLAKWDAGITQRFMANDMMKISTPEGQKAYTDYINAVSRGNPDEINKASQNPNLSFAFRNQGMGLALQRNDVNYNKEQTEALRKEQIETAKQDREEQRRANETQFEANIMAQDWVRNSSDGLIMQNVNSVIKQATGLSSIGDMLFHFTSSDGEKQKLARLGLEKLIAYGDTLPIQQKQSFYNFIKKTFHGRVVLNSNKELADNIFGDIQKQWSVNDFDIANNKEILPISNTGSDEKTEDTEIEQLRKDLTTTQTQITSAEDRIRGYDAQIAKAKTDKEKKKWEDLKARDTESLKQYKTKEEDINKKILEKSKPVEEISEPDVNNDTNTEPENEVSTDNQSQDVDIDNDIKSSLAGNVLSENPKELSELEQAKQARDALNTEYNEKSNKGQLTPDYLTNYNKKNVELENRIKKLEQAEKQAKEQAERFPLNTVLSKREEKNSKNLQIYKNDQSKEFFTVKFIEKILNKFPELEKTHPNVYKRLTYTKNHLTDTKVKSEKQRVNNNDFVFANIQTQIDTMPLNDIQTALDSMEENLKTLREESIYEIINQSLTQRTNTVKTLTNKSEKDKEYKLNAVNSIQSMLNFVSDKDYKAPDFIANNNLFKQFIGGGSTNNSFETTLKNEIQKKAGKNWFRFLTKKIKNKYRDILFKIGKDKENRELFNKIASIGYEIVKQGDDEAVILQQLSALEELTLGSVKDLADNNKNFNNVILHQELFGYTKDELTGNENLGYFRKKNNLVYSNFVNDEENNILKDKRNKRKSKLNATEYREELSKLETKYLTELGKIQLEIQSRKEQRLSIDDLIEKREKLTEEYNLKKLELKSR